MLKNGRVLFLLMLVAVVAFGCGLVELLSLRFEAGDIYPAYSSLRPDPLGAKAVFESFGKLPGYEARRLVEPLGKVESGRERVLFVLGTPRGELSSVSQKEYGEFERFMMTGGRVVIAVFPQPRNDFWERRSERMRSERESEQKEQEKKSADQKGHLEPKAVKLSESWGFKTEFLDFDTDEDGKLKPVSVDLATEDSSLPKSVAWHSAVYFEGLDSHWRVIYKRKELPVVIERSVGKGTLVLCSDSYPFSNEALRLQREPGFLAWFAGTAHEALFDETHLGTQETPGIAGLMRKYRLHGVVLALLVVAGLFIWNNSTSLVPADDDRHSGENIVTGKDSYAGFVNLLRRNIPQSKVLSVCVAEWRKTAGKRAELESKTLQVEELLAQESRRPAWERNPARAYQLIVSILSKKS